MRKISICIFLFLNLIFNQITAKIYNGSEANKLVKGAQKLILNDSNLSIKFIQLDSNTNISEQNIEQWLNETLFKNDLKNKFYFLKKKQDHLGFTQYKFIQKRDTTLVEYGVFNVHCKHGKIQSANGEYYPYSQIAESENYSINQALEKTKSHFNTTNQTVSFLQNIFFPDKFGKLILCRKIDFHAIDKEIKHSILYIDVNTNEILFEENKIQETNSIGSAVTLYSGTRPITTDSLSPTLFRLKENGTRFIHTNDLQSSYNYSTASDFLDNDNFWNTSTNLDKAANDVHFGAEKTWDFYQNKFGRNSYDDVGSEIKSYVHFGVGYVNAFWDGTRMTYGDGNGTSYGPLTSTEIVGHEITHALTQYSAGLVYANESGALNESFSDIFGVAIDFYANPGTANFLIGDQANLSGIPFRTMNDPNASLDPDTYQGTYWDYAQEVHQNSNVQNYWYYLLCTGGSGVNDNGDSYLINSITMEHASDIAYRTLTTYLTPNSNYADARFYSIQSAIDLFGICSAEEINVTNAWHAVGVGGIYTNAINTQFTAMDTILCGTPVVATFLNNTVNANSYLWDFGDGGTSTLSNPTHTYTTAGNFSVRLVAFLPTICGNSDTLIRSNYIHVLNNPVPISATCIPNSTNSCCDYGILNVSFNTINNNSFENEGYKDFTCGMNTTLIAGSTYQLNVLTGSVNPQFVNAYIDYNNDGLFSTNENVYNSNSILGLHSAYINTSSSATLGVPLRMRIISSSMIIPDACNSIIHGQAEDYTLIFIANTLPPIADFVVNPSSINASINVDFFDISSNAPTSWQWTITGGSNSSSSAQNANTIYNIPGNYTIKLVVSNNYGSDSITKNVVVQDYLRMCNPSSTQITTAQTGTIFDSGGPFGNYQNNEYCSILISPTCADSIKLSINSMALGTCCDVLRVYNGVDIYSPLLYMGNGNNLPPNLAATSGNMFINFISDGFGTNAGFEATWTTTPLNILPPIANFTFSPNNPPLLNAVNFTDASSIDVIAWKWDFGDGDTSAFQNPSHIYTLSGTYTITLIASSCNASDTISQIINIQAPPSVNYNNSSYLISLNCNDSANLQLVVQNNGLGTLNWNAFSYKATNSMLIWTYGVDMAANQEYEHTLAAINQYYADYTFDTTNTKNPSMLQNKLIGKKVLLIPENETGLSAIVSTASTVIQNFVQHGGTVIVCGDATGKSVQNLGIFNALNLGSINGSLTTINNSTPLSDSIPSIFLAPIETYSSQINNSNKTTVVSYNSIYDVLTYLPFGNGKAIFIAFDYSNYSNIESRIIANAVKWGMNSPNSNLFSLSPSGSVLPNSTDTINMSISSYGLTGGLDTFNLIVQTNAPNNLNDTIPIYLTVSSMPCVNFDMSRTSICSGTIEFIDRTNNSPTSWFWDFGDGSTSTSQNPSHIYTSSGTYIVKLIVTNAFGTDSSSTILSLIINPAPIPANCVPTVLYPYPYVAIKNVSFNGINNNSSDSLATYEDYSCAPAITLIEGSQYTLNVTTLGNYTLVRAWIDFNNDGIFSANEEIAYSYLSNTNYHSILVNIPTANSTLNASLRMRIVSYNGGNITNFCNLNYGQVEDYNVMIKPATSSPVADFSISTNPIEVGSNIYFSDLSTNGPTNWQWTMTGGTTSSSISQNTNTSFNTAGNYSIKLVVSNAFGSDSVTKQINVINSYTMCNPNYAQSTYDSMGILYDSGGPSGYYQDNESCNFTINSLCADSIKLSILAYSVDWCCDVFKVYDGIDYNGTLLYPTTSSSGIPTYKAVSGNMYISFHSDNFYTLQGFVTSWKVYSQVALPPTANFTYIPSNPPLSDTVHFTDLSSTDAASWHWDFGDGFTSNLQNPSHIYSSSGTYTITLISASCLAYDTIQQIINVQAPPSVTYTPTSFNATIGCNDSVSIQLLIHNGGAGSLNWNLESSNGTNSMLIWTYGVNMNLNAEYERTKSAINYYYTNYIYDTTSTTSSSVLQSLLVGKKVLLMPSNSTGLSSVIASAASVIQNFVQNGGTVIVCGDDFGHSVENIGIFNAVQSIAAFGNLNIINNSTPLSDSLPSIFQASNATFCRTISNPNKITVVDFGSSNDVVTYLPYGNGKAIFIAFNYETYYTTQARIIANAVNWAMNGLNNQLVPLPSSGSTLLGETDTVNLIFSSVGLVAGTYTYNAILHTNDPNNLTNFIPVNVTVNNTPCVNFGFTQPSACSGNITFTDSTTNAPISWFWDFGDGNTSTFQNPTHTYNSTGNYTVKLIVTNSIGTDSLIKNVYLSSISGPVIASCYPTTSNPSSFNGISQVILNTINNFSNNSLVGYEDFTCFQMTNLIIGTQYQLDVTTQSANEMVKAWIDFNNDGIFGNAEVIATMNSGFNLHSAIINLTNTGILLNQKLRLRIISDYGTITSACANLASGQVEDYTVTILPTIPPIASFLATPLTAWVNQPVQFIDLSLNGSTNWNWIFNGGVPSSSPNQNPSTVYTIPGFYDASLIASNPFGNDTTTMLSYIHVLSLPVTGFSYQIDPCTAEVTFGGGFPSPYTNNSWDFGDGTVINYYSPSITHTYANAGTYTVTFIAKSTFGNDTSTQNIVIPISQPSISHSGNLNPGSTINFLVNSSVNINSYLWDFGDLTATSTLANPTHSYTSNGTYIVSSNVEFSSTCQRLIYDTIQIQDPNQLPNLDINTPFIVASPNPFTDEIMLTFFNIERANKLDIKLSTILGQTLYANHKENITLKDNKFLIQPNLAEGIYLMEVMIDNSKFFIKVVRK